MLIYRITNKDIPFLKIHNFNAIISILAESKNSIFPVYLSRNATLMSKASDDENEYRNNLQGETPSNHFPVRSGKYKKKNANLNTEVGLNEYINVTEPVAKPQDYN